MEMDGRYIRSELNLYPACPLRPVLQGLRCVWLEDLWPEIFCGGDLLFIVGYLTKKIFVALPFLNEKPMNVYNYNSTSNFHQFIHKNTPQTNHLHFQI